MAKKKRAKRSSSPSQTKTRGLMHIEFEVTTEAIENPSLSALPDHVQEAFERLHTECRERPRKAISELLEWIEKYPNIPMLYNYLSLAYSAAGKTKKATETTVENYRRNPDYLFARLNYAEICLAKGDLDKVAEIFEHKFNLKMLYPERNRFHISEVVGFTGITGIYFCEIGERQAAEICFDVLKQLDPDHPLTIRLGMKLSPDPLRSLMRYVMGSRKKPF